MDGRTTHTTPHPDPTTALALALVLALATALWPAGSRPGPGRRPRLATSTATPSSSWAGPTGTTPSTSSPPSTRRRPRSRSSCSLGGSAARECTVSDADWAAQVDRRGGPEVVDLQHRLAQPDLLRGRRPGEGLPRGPDHRLHRRQHGPLHLAVHHQGRPAHARPGEVRQLHSQHHYSQARILTPGAEEGPHPRLARRGATRSSRPATPTTWDSSSASSAPASGAASTPSCSTCRATWPSSVTPSTGPIERYHRGCKALATRVRRAVRQLRRRGASLVNRDFFDLAHLVEPGRVKFQRLLSDKTVRLLERYDMMPTRSRRCRRARRRRARRRRALAVARLSGSGAPGA